MNIDKYREALRTGFGYYGINGFHEMHKDVCKEPSNPWGYALEPLNELSYEQFEIAAAAYLNERNEA